MKTILIILFFSMLINAANPLLVFKHPDGKWHFIDTDYKPYLIKDDIIKYAGYREGLHRAILNTSEGAKWCFFNDSGDILIQTDYDDVGEFYDGMSLVSINTPTSKFTQKFGFINIRGEEVLAPKKFDAIPFSEGKAYVMDRYSRGYINKDGKYVIKLADTLVGYRFSEGKASVSDPKYTVGLIDDKGKTLLNRIYDEPFLFSEGLSKSTFNGRTGVIDSNLNIVVPMEYYEVTEYHEGRAFISVRGEDNRHEWALFDKDGNSLTEHDYLNVRNFNGGLAAVQSKFKGWMWLDRDGNRYLNLQLDYVDNFMGKKTSCLVFWYK